MKGLAKLDHLVAWINARLSGSTAGSPTWPLALARIAMGVLWLASLRWKLPPDFDGGDQTGLREWLELEVEHAVVGFYGELIDSVVLPNFTLFAWLVFVAELLVGLALVTGIGARPAALVGLLMSMNLLVGLLEVPGEWPWSYLLMIMWHGTLLVSNAHTHWSLAARLSRSSHQPIPGNAV